ncbi:ribonuclease HI [Bdellovibrionota bacterium FG-1]
MPPTSIPIVIFADGACSGNPGPGGWGAIVATPDGQVSELGGADRQTTNNKMELTATIRALGLIRDQDGLVDVFTDSVYVIRGITQWIWGWRKNGWKSAEGKEVLNQELWKALSATLGARRTKFPNSKVDWKWVRGHSGVPGNERVDQIAVSFCQGVPTRLYRGALLGYGVAIYDIPENTETPDLKPRNEVKAQAYSYLSVVGNTPMRHKTWPECERRVKGQSGAKFKKALTAEDEAGILQSWGYQPKDVAKDIK